MRFWGSAQTEFNCCWQVEGFYHVNGRNLCFEGTVRVCKVGKNGKGDLKLFAPRGDGTTYIAGGNGFDGGSIFSVYCDVQRKRFCPQLYQAALNRFVSCR